MVERFNTAALTICRRNILSTSDREKLETFRSSIYKTSDLVVTSFPASPFTRAHDTPTAFTTYIGYWMGELRTTRRIWGEKQRFKKSAWNKLEEVATMLEAVAEMGLDGVALYFDDDKQMYSIKVR